VEAEAAAVEEAAAAEATMQQQATKRTIIGNLPNVPWVGFLSLYLCTISAPDIYPYPTDVSIISL
jgi:hypothetical protein